MQSYVLRICSHEDRSQTKQIYGLRGVCVGTHGSYVIYWQKLIPLICQGKCERNFLAIDN